MLIKPPRLKPGDTIGVAAPALPYYPEMNNFLDLGLRNLRNLGFQVKLADHVLCERAHLAVPAELRASDLNQLFYDPEVKAILCMAGGSNVNAVLPLLDWEFIQRHPKIVMGYGANTVLLLGLFAQARLVTFHGPHIVMEGFGEYPEPLRYTIDHLDALLVRGGASWQR